MVRDGVGICALRRGNAVSQLGCATCGKRYGGHNPSCCHGKRVRDRLQGDYGTVLARNSRGRFSIAWDRPTPHENAAWVQVPSRFFEWAE